MVEGVAGRVYNVTQAILLREHQHCVQKALHGIDGTNESRPVSRLPRQVITTGRGLEHLQLVRLVDEEHGDFLGGNIHLLLVFPVFLQPRLAIFAPRLLGLLPTDGKHALGPGRAVLLLLLVLLLLAGAEFRLALGLERLRGRLEVPVAEERALWKTRDHGCETRCEESGLKPTWNSSIRRAISLVLISAMHELKASVDWPAPERRRSTFRRSCYNVVDMRSSA